MSFETFTFFEIILAGFVSVWSYREFSQTKSKLSDFEYLGSSAFWGLFILVSFQFVSKITNTEQESINKLLGNPFSTGFIMSMLGFLGGLCFGIIKRDITKTSNKEKVTNQEY